MDLLHSWTRTLLLLSTLACLAAPSPLHAQAATGASADVSLAPGDVVRIAVWRHPEFSGDFPIDATGAISHPLFRSIVVAGIPLAQAEDRLRQFLTQYETNPAFTFVPLLRIFVVGEVRQPNTLTVPPGTTVAQAIALAGGPTNDADLHGVRLVRATGIIPLDLTRPDLAMANTTIRSGDQIVVARAGSFFRDVVGPSASVIAALAALVSIVVTTTKH